VRHPPITPTTVALRVRPCPLHMCVTRPPPSQLPPPPLIGHMYVWAACGVARSSRSRRRRVQLRKPQRPSASDASDLNEGSIEQPLSTPLCALMRAWRGARARRRNPLTCAEGGMQLMPARLCCAGNVGARPRCPRMPTAGDGGEGRMRRSPCVVSSVTFFFCFRVYSRTNFFIRFRTPLADPMACAIWQ
jgi:hypothetical protein